MTLISLQEAAQRLHVRPDYVQQLIRKQRLTLIADHQLDATQVDKLAALMDKLRQQGIATLVDIIEQGGDPHA